MPIRRGIGTRLGKRLPTVSTGVRANRRFDVAHLLLGHQGTGYARMTRLSARLAAGHLLLPFGGVSRIRRWRLRRVAGGLSHLLAQTREFIGQVLQHAPHGLGGGRPLVIGDLVTAMTKGYWHVEIEILARRAYSSYQSRKKPGGLDSPPLERLHEQLPRQAGEADLADAPGLHPGTCLGFALAEN